MGNVFWRSRLLAAVIAACACALAVFSAGASAATTTGGKTSATVGSGSTNVEFTGEVLATNFLPPDPLTNSPCPNQATDPLNAICEHFRIDVQATGTLQVCVEFDTGVAVDMNDVDVYLVGPDGTIVANGTTANNPECVTASVSTGHYEVQVNPSFAEGPAGIHGDVTFTPQQTSNGQWWWMKGDDWMDGHGQDNHGGQYGHREDGDKDQDHDKWYYKNDSQGCSFRSTHFDVANFTSTGKDLQGNGTGIGHFEGEGTNYGQPVTFVIDLVAAGWPFIGDYFTITTSDGRCHTTGHVTKGYNHYHHED